MGNYSRPLAISRFVKELSTAFSILNLKNDNLRKRFDSIKYDVKKIEEGSPPGPLPPCLYDVRLASGRRCVSAVLGVCLAVLGVEGTVLSLVVYDLSLRGLIPKEA